MDFDPTPEQEQRRARVRAMARERWADDLPPSRDPSEFRTRWSELAEVGAVGACLPAEVGGGGLGALDTALLLEDVGRACPDTGLVFAAAAHLLACSVPARDFSPASVEDGLLEALASGKAVAGNAMTEDGAGSDVTAIATTARREGDHYVLDGTKSFVSNAPVADVFVVYALTAPEAGFLGISAFLVPADLPGVRVGPRLTKLGLDGCPTARVTFTGCRVPAGRRLGAEGQGGAVFQHSMDWERACLPAIYLGSMRDQWERAVAHARERNQFGRAIGTNQAVSHRLSTMRQRMERSRHLLYRACWALDRGHADATALGAMSKVEVSESAVANSIDAVQIHGGAGFLAGHDAERRLRDTLPGVAFSGTNDIQREIVARGSGL